mgnify:CR=1 FL=1
MFSRIPAEKFQWSVLLLLSVVLLGCGPRSKDETTDAPPTSSDKTLTVYTFRNYANDQQLFRLFEQRTGYKIQVVNEKGEALVSKLLSEGASSKASLVILEDLSLMLQLKTAGALQQGKFGRLNLTIPARYSDPEQYWTGLSKWAPAFVYSTSKVNQQLIGRYADLVNPKWKNKVLVTSAASHMNQSLVATMLSAEGADATSAWVSGVVANLAEPPLADDYDVIRAIAKGKGDIGLINASSFIQFQRSGNPEGFKEAEGIGVLYPVNAGSSTYFNMTVAGIPANAPDAAMANKLIDFLTDQEVQKLFAETLYEYPLNPYSIPNDFLIEIGGIKEKEINFDLIGQNKEKAQSLMETAAWK